jgi:hypothetical protein
MSFGAMAVAGIGAGISLINANKNRLDAKDFVSDAEVERDKQQALLNKQKAQYKAMEFKNPFADMENTFEDLTVNQQQAQFQAQKGAQQRANIMQSMKGAAGGSGIAGLAQAMANQGQLQTQAISASIGQQESRNQALAAKGAANVQSMQRQGDQYVQQQEANRQATLLGMQMGETAGANTALQTAKSNLANAQVAQQQIVANAFGTVAQGLASNADTLGGTDNNIFTPKI